MEIREGFIEREKIRKKLHKGVVVFMMMMVMVVGFAYKIGKSEREDTQGERERERGWLMGLVENGLESDLIEGLRKMGVVLSLTPWHYSVLFSLFFLIFFFTHKVINIHESWGARQQNICVYVICFHST